MSPDMFPYVGSDAKVKNLFISCGHGPNGWTTSSGTGRFLTQVVFQIVFEGWRLIQSASSKNQLENLSKLIDGQMNENEAEIQNLLDPNRFNKVPI